MSHIRLSLPSPTRMRRDQVVRFQSWVWVLTGSSKRVDLVAIQIKVLFFLALGFYIVAI